MTVLATIISSAACSEPKPLPHPELMGAYRFDDGRLVSIRRSVDTTPRARFYESGESRRLYPRGELRFVTGSGFANSALVEAVVEFRPGDNGKIDSLSWGSEGAPGSSAQRVNRSETIRFESDGVVLAGRLDRPSRPSDGASSTAVVLVHGSGSSVATEEFYDGDFLAANGVATLTYDKRGTGASGGEFTFDFHQLARDAAAAVDYLSGRAGLSGARIGLSGYSQGAWVAPLAASMNGRVRFVIVSYGMVASPAEEARVETRNLLRARGVGEEDLDDIDELTMASVAIVASGFESGWDSLARLKKKHRRAPWRTQLRGTTVGKFLRFPRWLLRRVGPSQSPEGQPWYYDSMATLQGLEIPTFWLLAQADTSAPVELAVPFLEQLRAQGKSIEVRVFPDAEHGMLLYDSDDRDRIATGYAKGYFRSEVEAALNLTLSN